MDTPDFDEHTPAPLPAYDRQWRHPAEYAAADRSIHLSSAPRLSRRLSIFSAAISLMASVAVLAIAIPKGIADYSDEAEDVITIATVSVKGSLGAVMTSAFTNKGPTSAISLGDGFWLIALDAVGQDDTIWITTPTGVDAPAALTAKDEATGVAIVKCIHPGARGPTMDMSQLIDPSALTDLSLYRVVDSLTEQAFTPERSLKTVSVSADTPINTPQVIRGVATVTDEGGKVVGIVVRRGYSAWILAKGSVENLLQLSADAD
jgi:hypothetical protein